MIDVVGIEELREFFVARVGWWHRRIHNGSRRWLRWNPHDEDIFRCGQFELRVRVSTTYTHPVQKAYRTPDEPFRVKNRCDYHDIGHASERSVPSICRKQRFEHLLWSVAEYRCLPALELICSLFLLYEYRESSTKTDHVDGLRPSIPRVLLVLCGREIL